MSKAMIRAGRTDHRPFCGLARFLGALLVLTSISASASAARLDKEACEHLKQRQTKLASDGVRGHMERGPDWAKANLSSDKLALIKELMEVEERILFLCDRPRNSTAQQQVRAEHGATTETGATAPAKPKRAKTATKKPTESTAQEGAAPAAEPATAEAPDAPTPPKKKKSKKVEAQQAVEPTAATAGAKATGEKIE